jgi:hypothetical protein
MYKGVIQDVELAQSSYENLSMTITDRLWKVDYIYMLKTNGLQ